MESSEMTNRPENFQKNFLGHIFRILLVLKQNQGCVEHPITMLVHYNAKRPLVTFPEFYDIRRWDHILFIS
jgi:hypothetical protein